MKALILVGGFGTRLRPLTFSKPKPLVEFCNEPILEHQVKALKAVGVSEIILAVSYRPDSMMEALGILQARHGVTLTCQIESEPLGTAGPIGLARAKLTESDEPFFVLNSDVTCDYPLADLLAFHRAHGGEGTIMVTRVDEPSKYGVVVHDSEGKIQHFVEKPQTFVGNHINAGIYCFSPRMLARIAEPVRPTSIEKEIFPRMADEGQLFAMVLPGYWMDIGQPKDYLTGMCFHLASIRAHNPSALAAGAHIKGNVLIDPTATIGEGCMLGPDVVIGPGCVVEAGVRLSRTTLLAGTRISAHAMVSNSIIGWRSVVGKWARVEGGSVFGEDVTLGDETAMNGAIILPHKSIKESIYTPGTIVM